MTRNPMKNDLHWTDLERERERRLSEFIYFRKANRDQFKEFKDSESKVYLFFWLPHFIFVNQREEQLQKIRTVSKV